MQNQGKKVPSLKSQSAWLLFAKFVGYFFAFLFPLLVVRILAKAEVGIYRWIFQVIINLAAILPLGFSMSVYYFLSRSEENRSKTIFHILIFNFVMGAVAFVTLFFFPQILGTVLQNEEMTRLAPTAGIVIWLWIFGSFLEVVAVANKEPKVATVFIVLSQATKTFFMSCAVVWFQTVDSILYAAMFQAGLQIIILLWYLNSRFPKYWTSFDLSFFRRQIAYALPFGFAGILWIIQTDIHNYFVGVNFGEVQYAIYAYGCFEFPLISMLYESISSVMIPRMSELQSRGQTQKIIETAVSAMNKIALTFLPVFTFLMILATPLFITLFTEEYLEAVPIFRINTLLLPVYILILDPITRAYDELGKFLLKFRICLIIVMISALWFGIQHFDLRGMIGIVVVSIVIERIATFIKLRKVLGLKWEHFSLLKTIGRTAIANVFSAIFLFLFYWFTKDYLFSYFVNLFAGFFEPLGITKWAGFFGGSMYLGICFLFFAPIYYFIANQFNLIDEDEKDMLRNLISKIWVFSKKEKIQPSQSETSI